MFPERTLTALSSSFLVKLYGLCQVVDKGREYRYEETIRLGQPSYASHTGRRERRYERM